MIYPDQNNDKTNRDARLKSAENIKAKRLIELINEEQGFLTKLNPQMSYIEYYETLMEGKIPKDSRSQESLKFAPFPACPCTGKKRRLR